MSKKFQITLPEDLAAAMKSASTKSKIPLAQYIRETMEERLRQEAHKQSRDPFASITDLVDSEEPDLASRVDEILYR